MVVERGWVAAGLLKPGDPLLSRDRKRVRVASVTATGLVEEVYNLQVEGHHTYYVSDGDPSFSLLAHNASAGDESHWTDILSAEKNGLNKALGNAVNWVGGLLNSGTMTKNERQQAAAQHQEGFLERNVPKAHEIDALPDLRKPYAKGNEDTTNTAQRQRNANVFTAVVPGINDARDVYEVVTGKDLVTGEKLTADERMNTLRAAAVPGVSGAEVRAADRAMKAAQKSRRAGKAVARGADDLPDLGSDVMRGGKPLSEGADAAGQTGKLAPQPSVNTPIRNAHLAGKKHPVTGVPFDAQGFPDFSSVSKKTVKIKQTGSRTADFAEANKAAGLKSTPEGYTWHHHQDGTTMQLVPRDVHRATGHTGGFALGPAEPGN
ncbi:MAG TPA: HNH endonuclease [Pirellulales bacterium]|nr:HNH endonuclease [Pirellulales bacterium]